MIQDYLDEKLIDYKTSGKNIGKNWIGLKSCPFCGDSRHHFAIKKTNGKINCWSCQKNGSFINFLMKIEKISFPKAKKISENYIDNNYFFEEDEEKHIPFQGDILPKEASINFPKIHLDYLKSRGFNPQQLIKKYKLQACHNLGKYRFRIIAPVFIKKQIVNFVGADVTGKSEIKYKFPPNNKVEITIHDTLYNIDDIDIGGYCVLTEGITDSWRIGKGAICSFGKNLSQSQINLLIEKEINRVIIIPDSDAQENGEKVANSLSGIINQIDIVMLEKGDPGDLTQIEVKKLRMNLDI